MKLITKIVCSLGAFAALCACSIHAQEPVSIESLLKEMVDRDSVARFPETNFRLKQHTSYNRASVSPDDEKGWFANGDFNKGPNAKNFIRIEENHGRKEWVMMDHQGAGAIVRSWQPFRGTPKNRILRIYLDGSDVPAIEGNPHTLFNGEGMVPYPLAHPSLLSAVNFFPIPYAKSCKVTMSELPYFFIFTFREYEEGSKVKTFTMEDFEAAKALTEKTGQLLLNPTASGAEAPLSFSATLNDQETKSLDLPTGEAAVRELSVKLGSYENPNVTRQVVLKIEFDGKETVWCPIGDFFGSGVGLNPVQGWYRTVAEDGTMSCRWVMPYQQGGKVTLQNLSGAPVEAELSVKTGEWTWDERTMYFNAGWRGQYPVPTRPKSDWNYITTQGRGVYVADTLTIMNPQPSWWGEGDAKIWVDGEDFPSLFGTGTEDYYAYSWGGVSTDFYEHPFHAQPFSFRYNKLNRKEQMAERDTRGFSTESRSRALDTMPFSSSLQLDMEVWSGADCDMGYQVGMMWYAFAETTSNCKPEPEEVLNVPPLPDMGVVADKKEKKSAPVGVKTPVDFKNAVEIEPNMVISKSGKIQPKAQNLRSFKGEWNESDHILFKGAEIGDVVEIRIPASGTAAQTLTLYATQSRDFGMLRLYVNGELTGPEVDFYAPGPVPSGGIELGEFAPVDGAYILRVEVLDVGSKSKGALFGLDCITFSNAQPAAALPAGTVTIQSLLKEMADRDAVAEFPSVDFRLKQASSYNRKSKTPEDAEGWFNNKDFGSKTVTEGVFIRVEENSGRKEWVLMDHQGPGAIVRSWQPFRKPPENVVMRFYLDGSDTPVLEGNPCNMLNGKGLFPYPFAHDSLLSAVSFYPIPYAKSCKVTLSELPFFYQFTYREYAEGTPVKTLTMTDFEAAKPLVDEIGQKLLNPQAEGAVNLLTFSATLATNQEKSIDLPTGTAAVRELSVKLGDYSDPNITRLVVLKIEFDGKETVWCPVGDFFGSGVGLNPYQGWYRTVAEDGSMTCRWVMPFQHGGKVSLVNLGAEKVNAEVTVKTGAYAWNERSMYFHAGWRGQYPVATRPFSDWNYITTQGRGVYVGDTLTVMNPVDRWWGEGDEKIFVDGESFPSIFGTGTEDYYAYSWGGVSTDFYDHPFHAQPFSHKYNKLNRKPKGAPKSTRGFSVETRSRSLDTMPFSKSLQLDMEVWSWAECDMGYQVGVYWYGDAETTSNLQPEPSEILNVPPLPDMNTLPKKKKPGQKDPDEV
ncbi:MULTISPECIES: glycoside hydrolase family 172 protein [unclassified Lentimonas]|uniref:glycoside hydrolase family 172 protein n=1 Tax=unclassified Lentimonas TaxID=2630993 RepID=UPI00132B9C77|nr:MULTISPECIES: glycoside hydrolase family 172 protein [unclassified Lentimonas]CAA6692459.1 Unannotated [Lentimonas sp. CC19]CAA6693464.1 Unannotated [Lentimonas sp. CC10]CAA7070793.1 Unannotated [Lentimonas sp. CC11]